MKPPFGTLVEMLRVRAAVTPHAKAYTFLADGEREAASLTYSELDARARAVACALRAHRVEVGARALLLYPPGLDFVAGFFGSLYAGVTAVPCYPPHPAQVSRTLPRVLGIVADAAPAVVLGPAELVELAPRLASLAPALRALPWIATDGADSGAEWSAPPITGSTRAFLQYTSGSTRTPHGVMVSHDNLLHNLGYANWVEGNDATSVAVSWLPVIHDMGLIEGVLEPVFGGYPSILMAPASFLQRPIRWLRAIQQYRATNSGGPNFAYDLCVRKIKPDQRETLDLSSWRVAYNGAEPIRAETLRSFHAAFRECGFRWKSFYPAYGLAEATLVVSSGRRDYMPVTVRVDVGALGAGRFEVIAPDAALHGREMVSSGPPGFGTEVRIVDPETCMLRDAGEIGEICVSSPSVAQGYWGKPEESERVFRARIAGVPGRTFLRTGDLGVLREGELFVAGRRKDVLILRGVKHHPQDIEKTAEALHPALRPGCGAAFAVAIDGEEQAVLAIEVEVRQLRHLPPHAGIIKAVREGVLREHGVALHEVVLLAPGTIPKTTSGKIRRHACALAWQERRLVHAPTAIAPYSDAGDAALLGTGT